jgi:hypothetical protein
VVLSGLVQNVKQLDTLRAVAQRVNEAATRGGDATVREYAGRAARHIEKRLQSAAMQAKAE